VDARRGLQLVSKVVRTLSQTSEPERSLPSIARATAEAIPDSCVLSVCGEDGKTLTRIASHDVDPTTIALAERQFVSGATAALMQPTVLVAPMRASAQWLGLVTVVRNADHAPFDALDLEVVDALAGHVALAIHNARLAKKLERGEELQQTTQFLDAIVENIPDMVFVKDADKLSFVRFNRAGEELLGMSRADLIGKTDDDFFPKSEAAFFTQKDRETLANKQLVEIFEEPIQTRAGTRWLHTKKVPLVDANGTPRFLLGISQDITERKRADAALRSAKETVEHANKELEAFAYSIVHDLRSPLRGILGYSAAVLEDAGDKLDARPREYLRRMQVAAARMATLIEDLLGLARVTQADLVRTHVDLAALAASAIGGLQHTDKNRSAEIVIQPNLFVDADPHMMAIVLENLLDNAWKFTSKREHARIEIGKTDNAFFVRDNGAGFDMAYTEQLFGVFRRLHMQEDFAGTGIGLATVARIIHRHHGRVWAEGRVGEGATFYFTVGDSL